MLEFIFAYNKLLGSINWIITCGVLICISLCLTYWFFLLFNLQKIISFIRNKKFIFMFLLLFLIISIILIKNIPIREGYDNYHGIGINTFSKYFKETAPIIIISTLNELFGYRMEIIFTLNYLLSIGCSLILGIIIYLRLKNVFASILSFILLMFSPMSLILTKTISSAHVNLFFFLLTLLLFTLFNYYLKETKQEPLFLFAILSLLIPLINNVRQEFLIFLFPFALESIYFGIKSGFIARNKRAITCLIIISFSLFIFFNIFQLSLRHHNYPHSYIDLFCIFSPKKFELVNGHINSLFGVMALIAILLLVIRRDYFFSFALFLWLLSSSNIYPYYGEFPLRFLRHELYLSIPYIISLSIIGMELYRRQYLHQFIKLSILGITIAMYIIFTLYSLRITKSELRTTDYVLQFFHKVTPGLSRNMKLVTPGIRGGYSGNLFTYLISVYAHKFTQAVIFTSLSNTFYVYENTSAAVNSYILYYPEICDLLEYANKNEARQCQKFKLYLGKPIVTTSFIHKYNSVGLPTKDEILLTTGFYEPLKESDDSINKSQK